MIKQNNINITFKVLNKILVCLIVLVFTFCMCSCHKNKQNNKKNEILNPKIGLYYRVPAHSSVIYTIESSRMTSQEYALVTSIQGIVAQTQSSIFIIEDSDDQLWLEQCVKAYDLSVVPFDNAWDLVTIFKSYVKESKFVLYNHTSDPEISYSDLSINYATTIAGVENYIMVSKSLEEIAISKGFELGLDVTTSEWNTEHVFNTYKDVLTKKYLVHQEPSKGQLRDYAIAGKALCYYADYYDGNSEIGSIIANWADKNAPILGWTENEVNFVSANSLLSKITVAADWAANLSFYSSLETENEYQQNINVNVKAQTGKHYVAIVMSDGDNLQWMTNNFATSNLYYGSSKRGNFKMTWTTTPSMYDLSPNILDYLYKEKTSNDEFIAGPSGIGYINASEYQESSLPEYAQYVAGYLDKTDMHIVNFLDNYIDDSKYAEFAKYDQIKGGILSIGNYYLEGKGGVYWQNDKPFICVRDTLWRAEGDTNHNNYYGYVERVAQRINNYSTDYTKIEGYTVVLAHAWSIGSMDYLQRFVESLDEHVELVTASELIDLVSKNVKHKNVEELNDIKPEDLKNELVPISTEQYTISDFEKLDINPTKKFMFTSESELEFWKFNCGGLQYDFAGMYDGKIKLDGSDLDDKLDYFPNSWMYSKFHINENDNLLEVKVNSGDNGDANYRLRVLYLSNGKLVSDVLVSKDYDRELNEFGYYLLSESSPSTFIYDLSPYKGKDVMISIEQDDSGEGSGEIVNVNKFAIVEEVNSVSTKNYWNSQELFDEWKLSGRVVKHTEGLCLENFGNNSSISCKVQLSNDCSLLSISVRKFLRSGGTANQDKNAQIVLKINGEIVKANNAELDYVSVTLGNFRIFQYDISKFAGQTVTIELINQLGEHACFDQIFYK